VGVERGGVVYTAQRAAASEGNIQTHNRAKMLYLQLHLHIASIGV
jgi:hypothetical protein